VAFENQEGRGALFDNKDKKKTDKHPDYTGSAKIDGKDYFVSMWFSKAKGTGKEYLSLSFTEKTNQSENVSRPAGFGSTEVAKSQDNTPEYDDDIPF